MLFRVPSLDALRLALSSGAIPERIAMAAADVASAADGTLHLRSGGRASAALSRDVQPFGIEIEKGNALPTESVRPVVCWLQLLPLTVVEVTAADLSNRAVLFEVRQPSEAVRLSSEILRLGNDRQSLARLEGPEGERTLLRVFGPPYYTVLRAFEAAAESTVRAYVERQAGVWIEVGRSHPLGDRISVAEGETLLLRAPDDWTTLATPHFQDLYDVASFELSAAGRQEVTQNTVDRFRVPLRLSNGGEEPAEMWVLRSAGIAQLEDFVASSDDDLLGRLTFAVAEDGEEACVLIRTRPGRGAPPVLIFDGLALRSYLKLDNLFVPCGTRVRPPLRRDVLQRLLADDPDELTWLEPTTDGAFRTLHVAEDAFRPLTDWVDYVLDHDRDTLTAWADSFQFEFDEYVVDDDPQSVSTTPVKGQSEELEAEDDVGVSESPQGNDSDRASLDLAERPKEMTAQETTSPQTTGSPSLDSSSFSSFIDAAESAATRPTNANPDEASRRLKALEAEFLAAGGPFDSPARDKLWIEMAELHERLEAPAEAATCRLHALWDTARAPAGDAAKWRRDVELAAGLDPLRPHTAQELTAIADDETPAPSRVAVLAAVLIAAEYEPHSVTELLGVLPSLTRGLERHERLLPVRAAWMAWRSVSALSGGDSLALVRARDRLLERLHRQGLNPQLDAPAFLRIAMRRTTERSHRVAAALVEFNAAARGWIAGETNVAQASPFKPDPNARTAAYSNLLFAYGLSAVEARDASQELVHSASAALRGVDAVHDWLLDAFESRIDSAALGQENPLTEALTARLQREPLRNMSVGPQKVRATAVIDQLRRQSQILEPTLSRNPFRWNRHEDADPVARELQRTDRLSDPDERCAAARRVLATALEPATPAPRRQLAIYGLLEMAPRLGAGLTAELLPHVTSLLEAAVDPAQEAQLLEKAIAAAAHFDLIQFVPSFVERLLSRFEKLLSIKRNPQDLEPLASLLGRSTRVLQRLGFHEQSRTLASRATAQIEAAEERADDEASNAPRKRPADEPANTIERQIVTLVLLLRFVPSHVRYGEVPRIHGLLDRAEAILFPLAPLAEVPRPPYRLLLVRTWCEATAALGLDDALSRLARVFRELQGIHRPSSTDSHFSAALLSVVEAVVQSLVQEDLQVDPAVRRLLDDSEYVLRRRIHDDLRERGV